MTKNISLLACFFFFVFTVMGQHPGTSLTQRGNPDNQPLFFVGTIPTTEKYFIADPGVILSVNVYKGPEATEKYGEAGRNGVILIHCRPGVSLLQIQDIFDQLDVPEPERKMNVYLNEVPVQKPELLLIEPSQLRSIHTQNEINWDTSPGAGKRERSLHIRTHTAKSLTI